jgi:hypothetical protein
VINEELKVVKDGINDLKRRSPLRPSHSTFAACCTGMPDKEVAKWSLVFAFVGAVANWL